MKKIVLLAFVLVLLSTAVVVRFVRPAIADGTICIRADGSIDPPTAPIQRNGNLYTFADNIFDSIVVLRSNITIDGNGYTVQGTGTGIDLWESNVTIKNTNIKGFSRGICLSYSSNNSIVGNNITANNEFGIYLTEYSSNTNIVGNNITNNGFGINLYSSSYNSISGNLFINDGLSVFYTHGNVVVDNLVNDKPLVYLEGMSHVTVVEAGQVVLVNCEYIQVENLNLSHTAVGLQLLETKNAIISGNNITNNRSGIELISSSNNSVSGNNITYNDRGIWLSYSSNNSIIGNNITANNWDGIWLTDFSNNNSIIGNNITANNWHGISLATSSYNSIIGNNITNNHRGISLSYSSNNTLRSNSMTNNTYNFEVWGWSLSDFVNDVDASNTVNGKLVYYWINERNRTILPDAGYVALVNCTCITVQKLNLTNNSQGILLAFTTNLTIANNNITNNSYGIYLVHSSNNKISANDLTNNYDSIYLHNSSSNEIYANNITNNQYGIHLIYSNSNYIYHNNFVNNAEQVNTFDSVNVWDDGYPSGGNYWSDYTGVDANMDGIGDSSYEIDSMNIDHYPLMGMFSDFPVTLETETYHVTTVCNSTISAFEFDQVNKIIRFNVTGEEGIGFCRVCIPHNLMEPPYTVTVDGHPPQYINYTLYDNGTHRWIYFTYQHSTHEVIIVPEFPTWTSMLLILIVLTVAIAIYKRRLLKTPIH